MITWCYRFGSEVDVVEVARRLSRRRNFVWLDSAAPGPPGSDGHPMGRFSFLSVDPDDTLTAAVEDPNPWPTLKSKIQGTAVGPCDDAIVVLDSQSQSTGPVVRPPIVGGWVGFLGYEAGHWLETIPIAKERDLSSAALHLSHYSWFFVTDHVSGESALWGRSSGRYEAEARCAEIQGWLAEEPMFAETPFASQQGVPRDAPPPARSNMESDAFRAAVDEIILRIRRGDCFQVNLAHQLCSRTRASALATYKVLRAANPAPMAGFYDACDFQILCSSPEGFLQVRDGVVETRPIKGTIGRSRYPMADLAMADQLSASEKDRAENIMIVDLMRNDLSRVCDDTSVEVPVLCRVEKYAHVQHLVSVVRGRLRPECDCVDLLAACFPGGSITGAPKIEAMRIIAELERSTRGPYCGSLGYISDSGSADFNILIRTMTYRDGQLRIPVGGGITARSDAAAEERETWIKARGMMDAVAGGGG
ncbi:MAG: anthranilate synthase component I family protein [Planctomycetota bacterium]